MCPLPSPFCVCEARAHSVGTMLDQMPLMWLKPCSRAERERSTGPQSALECVEWLHEDHAVPVLRHQAAQSCCQSSLIVSHRLVEFLVIGCVS